MGLFGGCQITLDLDSTYRFKQKLELRKKVTDNGGLISFIVTKKVSYRNQWPPPSWHSPVLVDPTCPAVGGCLHTEMRWFPPPHTHTHTHTHTHRPLTLLLTMWRRLRTPTRAASLRSGGCLLCLWISSSSVWRRGSCWRWTLMWWWGGQRLRSLVRGRL